MVLAKSQASISDQYCRLSHFVRTLCRQQKGCSSHGNHEKYSGNIQRSRLPKVTLKWPWWKRQQQCCFSCFISDFTYYLSPNLSHKPYQFNSPMKPEHFTDISSEDSSMLQYPIEQTLLFGEVTCNLRKFSVTFFWVIWVQMASLLLLPTTDFPLNLIFVCRQLSSTRES